jgi:hypothetical protein
MNGSLCFGNRNGPARKDKGLTTPGCLFFLALLILLVFVGYRFGEAFWEYYQVREQVREVLTWAVAGEVKEEGPIAQRVISSMKQETALSLAPRNVRVTQTSAELAISVSWTRNLDFFVYVYPMDFEVRLGEIKRWGGRGLVIK